MIKKTLLVSVLSLLLSASAFTAAQSTDNSNTKKAPSSIEADLREKHLGVMSGMLTKQRAQKLKIPRDTHGVLVYAIIKDSPADRAGLKVGDLIIEIEGQPITSPMSLQYRIQSLAYDKVASMRVVRTGVTQELVFKLDKASDEEFAQLNGSHTHLLDLNKDLMELDQYLPAGSSAGIHLNNQAMQGFLQGQRARQLADQLADTAKLAAKLPPGATFQFFAGQPRLGITTEALTPQLRHYFGVEEGQGVLISSVLEKSAAQKAGLQAGDIVIDINGVSVNSPTKLRQEIIHASVGEVRIGIIRNHQHMELRPILPEISQGNQFFNSADDNHLSELDVPDQPDNEIVNTPDNDSDDLDSDEVDNDEEEEGMLPPTNLLLEMQLPSPPTPPSLPKQSLAPPAMLFLPFTSNCTIL